MVNTVGHETTRMGHQWSTQWDMRLPEWDMGHQWSTQWDMRLPE